MSMNQNLTLKTFQRGKMKIPFQKFNKMFHYKNNMLQFVLSK